MKVTNTIKTGVCVDFLLAILVNYGNSKKSSKRLRLKYLKTVIEFYCESGFNRIYVLKNKQKGTVQ